VEHKQEWRVQVTVAHGVVTSAPATFKRPHTGQSMINGGRRRRRRRHGRRRRRRRRPREVRV
jgi:hypothetical protein